MRRADGKRATRYGTLAAVLLWALSCQSNPPKGERAIPSPSTSPKPERPAAIEIAAALKERRQQRGARFVAAEPLERQAFETWLSAYIHLPPDRGVGVPVAPAGFSAEWLVDSSVWLLRERDQRRGAGAFLLRPAATRDWIVEVPHSYFDQRTLPLGIELFIALDARALLVNTLHRGGAQRDANRKARARSGTSPYDVAHAETSFFQSAHSVLSSASTRALGIQLHGFASEKAEGVDAIVSGAKTDARVAELARALQLALGGFTTRLYPQGIQILGGTLNAQASLSRDLGVPFVHLELSARLRDALAEDPAVRTRFVGAVSSGLDHYR